MIKKKKKPARHKGLISRELLQRIDNIDDEKDFDPYKALKKNAVKNTELFNAGDYEIQEDDIILQDKGKVRKQKIINIITALIVGLIVTGIVGGLLYILATGGLNI